MRDLAYVYRDLRNAQDRLENAPDAEFLAAQAHFEQIEASKPDFSPHVMAEAMGELTDAMDAFGQLLAAEEGQDERTHP